MGEHRQIMNHAGPRRHGKSDRANRRFLRHNLTMYHTIVKIGTPNNQAIAARRAMQPLLLVPQDAPIIQRQFTIDPK